jgi:NAD(P)H-hydrate epimerase
MSLPLRLYSVAQVRALDARAITGGVPGYMLMKRAGEAALRALRSRWPRALRVVIVAGGGNNGGDGYVLARFAQQPARALVSPPCRCSSRASRAPPATTYRQRRPGAALRLGAPRGRRVIVDALLGTLAEPVRGGWRT